MAQRSTLAYANRQRPWQKSAKKLLRQRHRPVWSVRGCIPTLPKTLRMTYADLPHEHVDLVILVDDASSDETATIARELGLSLFVHTRNYGYGANQKT